MALSSQSGGERLTSEDLEFCTCGRCQAGDPVRSVDGNYLTEEVPRDAEVFPVITLPPHTKLAAQARRVPLIDDAFRSAGDLAVLDVPWRCAFGNGLIAIRSGQAVPRPDLPDPDNADQLLPSWQEAFEEELGTLDDMGGRILPGMLSMLGEQFNSVVFPVLKLLYRLPDEEWLDTGSLMPSLGADAGGSGTSLRDVFILESTARRPRTCGARLLRSRS